MTDTPRTTTTPSRSAPSGEAVREALPANIGRLHLGERASDGERLCSHSHEVPAGHPLYWPERMGEYPDDVDPLCLEHAIEEAVSDNGWCEVCTGAAVATPQPSSDEEPVAWLHTLHMEGGQTYTRLLEDDGKDPDEPSRTGFGFPGRDYSEEYRVTAEPLYRSAMIAATPTAQPPSEVDKLREALEAADDILESYIGYLHRMPAADIEMHPYIPSVEDACDKVRSVIAALAGDITP